MDKPLRSLSRKIWINRALQKLTDEGIDKVSIAALARDLSVTKGSFYWHFKGREDLHQAMLEHWGKVGSEVVFKEVDRVGGDGELRLKHMSDIIFKRYGDQLNLELALRDWGRKDPKIWEIIARCEQMSVSSRRSIWLRVVRRHRRSMRRKHRFNP